MQWFVRDRPFQQWRHHSYSLFFCWHLHSSTLPISRTSFNEELKTCTYKKPTTIVSNLKKILVKKQLRFELLRKQVLHWFFLSSNRKRIKIKKNVISETFCHDVTFFPEKKRKKRKYFTPKSAKRPTTEFQMKQPWKKATTYYV